MINIDKFKKFVSYVSNKNGRGTITPEQFNTSVERVLFAWTNKQIGDSDQANPKSNMDIDQVSMEKLRHLKEHREFRVISRSLKTPNGIDVRDLHSNIAPKYWFLSALSHKVSYNDFEGNFQSSYREIDIVKDSEFAVRDSSKIKPPTIKKAIAVLRADDFEISPSLVKIAKLVYIRDPEIPLWAYDMINKRPVYNATNSTDIDAPISAWNELAMIYLQYLGIHIRENELVQYAVSQENSPQ
jgi:hypothetical protein